MDIQKELDESIAILDNWLNDENEVYLIQQKFALSVQQLNAWILKWKEIYAIVRKKSYTLSDATALAAIFDCIISRVGTKYNLISKNGVVLFTGNLTSIVDYCFNNLIDLPSQ